jgi:hypothetical protein
MRILYFFFALIMIVFVAVQYNDPDAILWMLYYGYAAVVLMLAGLNKYNRIATIIGIIGYSIGALYLMPSVYDWITLEHGQNLMQQMNNDKMYIEETRECGGLIIATTLMVVCLLGNKKKQLNG